MADNIAITAGVGTDVGTHEVDSVHYQRVILSVLQGEPEEVVDLPGTSTDGLDVRALLLENIGVNIGDVTVADGVELTAGSALIGSVQRADLALTRVSKRVAVSASQTGATVWDPTGGTKFVLTKLAYSATVAGTIQLFDETDSGNTVIGPIMSVAQNGDFAFDWPPDAPYRSAADDNILKYTSGSGTTGSLYVEGWEE